MSKLLFNCIVGISKTELEAAPGRSFAAWVRLFLYLAQKIFFFLFSV